MVDIVNRLAAATASEGPIGYIEPSRSPATAPQSESLATIAGRVHRGGRCPTDLSPQAALKELLQAKDLYSQEPQHLAPYDPSLLKILSTVAQPLPATTLLPPEESSVLSKPELLARSSEDLEQHSFKHSCPKPYWDPLLRKPSTRRDFLRRLAKVGLLTGTDCVHSEVGFLCVKKKGGKQRLISDARMANWLMRLPLKTKLGSAAAMAELDLSDLKMGSAALDDDDHDASELLQAAMGGTGGAVEFEVRSSAADVDDSFYQFHTPQLASCFAIRELVDPRDFDITTMWCSRLGKVRAVAPGEKCYLGFSCLPMGWSWALHFCHTAVSHLARFPSGIATEATIQERAPAPSVAAGRPALGIYVDNVYSIGCRVGDSLTMVSKFVEEADRRSLRIHWECKDAEESTSRGVEVWGRQRPLRPSNRRLWRLHLAARALLGRAKVDVVELQVWVGHFVNVCQLCRPLLSVLEATYAWLTWADAGRAALWPAVREEIWMAGNLCFLAGSNLALPWSPTVYISDSSDFAYAVMWTKASAAEIGRDGQYRERWRFARMETPTPFRHYSSASGEKVDFASTVLPPMGSGGIGGQTRYGLALLSESQPETKSRLGRSKPRPARDMCDVELLQAIPRVGDGWERRSRWRTYREGAWRWPSEHINLKEGRASLMALERHVSSAQQHHCRVFQLSDNLVSLCAFDKGRSKSWALNALCRRSAALCIDAAHEERGQRRR